MIPIAEMREAQPDLIVHDYWPWYMAVGVLASKVNAGRTALRVLPTFEHPFLERTRFGLLSMEFIFRAVDGAKVPGADGERFAQRFGIPLSRTARVAQTIDGAYFASASALAEDERERRREELGVSGCAFVCVGRLWSGKGLDYLFEAYRRVSEAYPDVSLLLVGDGPDEEKYRALAARLPNVVFAGWVPESGLPDYLAVGDVLVFPTLGDPHGLVVEEAMAAGKPVISSDRAGDIRQRLDEDAGFVVPGCDSAALAEKMLLLAKDPSLRTRMGQAAYEAASVIEHSQYARDFVAFVEKMLALPARGSRAARQALVAGRALQMIAQDERPREHQRQTSGQAAI